MSYNIRTIDRRVVQQSAIRFVALWLFLSIGSALGLATWALPIDFIGIQVADLITPQLIGLFSLFFFFGAWLPAGVFTALIEYRDRVPGGGTLQYTLSAALAFIILTVSMSVGLYIFGKAIGASHGFGVDPLSGTLIWATSAWLPAVALPKVVEWMDN